MKTTSKLVLGVLALGASASIAQAQTTVYKGYDASNGTGVAVRTNADAASAQFQSALAGTSTESFESFGSGTGAPLSLSFAGSAGALTANLTGAGSVSSSPTNNAFYDRFATDGTKYYEVDSNDFKITFGTPVAAFGFYATDIESDVQLILGLASGGTQTYGFASLFPDVDYSRIFASPTASVNFLGFINTTDLFTSVTFGQGPNSGGDVLGFDQMTIGDARQVVNPPAGAVPEPATWAMMMLGFGVVGFAMRRKAKVNTRVRFA
ncbi:MAG: PEPxxWA-CTERM sorting domain-containing protein [Sphingomonas phyllosphaerae]|uniref:PEPxxWA-CTERM sorting domain-containing protein n=1 Tax=Sphingomonas phyllosphaerae TaxID=257003 RepID=UPI002FFBDC90